MNFFTDKKTKTGSAFARSDLSSLENIEINDEWRNIIDTIENTHENIFITGKAGTGKSTLLRYFTKHTQKRPTLLAYTGAASVNIGGQTIHSFFGFKPGITVDRIYRFDEENMLYKNLKMIIIDEISMVRADLLDCMDKFLRLNGPTSKLPFGGVQMVFIGDLYQLSPIVRESERELFKTVYRSPFFFDSKVFHKAQVRNFLLRKVYRQSDTSFIETLDAIRLARADDGHLEEINKRCSEINDQEHGLHVHLVTTNPMARNINGRKLNQLKSPTHSFKGTFEGEFNRNNLPTDEELHFKEGALVMLLNNDSNKRWVNGDIAIIDEIKEENGFKQIFVKLDHRSVQDEVYQYTWEEIRYFYNPEKKSIDSESIGTYIQYPLKLAWAVTIHKGQGKTFDKAIVDFGRRTFAHGQAYVALSRCRGIEGLVMKTPLEYRHIIVDQRVNEFMESLTNQNSLFEPHPLRNLIKDEETDN